MSKGTFFHLCLFNSKGGVIIINFFGVNIVQAPGCAVSNKLNVISYEILWINL